jgi:hypothetical protein
MVELLLSQTGYGDDFHFIKQRRTNRIVSNHSQGRALKLSAGAYASYAFDQIKENFINKNAEFFKAVYFDFAVSGNPVVTECLQFHEEYGGSYGR